MGEIFSCQCIQTYLDSNHEISDRDKFTNKKSEVEQKDEEETEQIDKAKAGQEEEEMNPRKV